MVKWRTFNVDQFPQWVSTWDELNGRTANSLLLDSTFVTPLLNHFSSGRELLALGFSGKQCVAATIVHKTGFGRWETFQPSQSPLGCWLCSSGENLQNLLDSLANALPGLTLAIGITQQDPALLPRPNVTSRLTSLDYITTAKLHIPRDFGEYWKSRSKNVRQNVNRARNRLVKQGIDPTFEVISDADRMESMVGLYGTIESEGWKSETGTAVAGNNAQGLFYTELLQLLAPGRAEIWRYRYNDDTVAMDLCLKQDDYLLILKTTYDENWNRYSPAFSMHVDGIEHYSNSDLKSFEFYGPTMDWHRKLTDQTRTMYHLNWYRFGFLKNTRRLRTWLS